MSPYSSPIPELETQRYELVLQFTTNLLISGFHAFSPIVYCHNLAIQNNLGRDAKTWMKFNMEMLRHAEVAYLLQLPGWEKSQGIKVEMGVCKMFDIPVIRYASDFSPIQ